MTIPPDASPIAAHWQYDVENGVSTARYNGNVISSGGGVMLAVSDVNSLSLVPVNGTAIYLEQDGRFGTFKFVSGDLSAFVTADTAKGVYIGPAFDPTGKNGAWVRQINGPLNALWFGAIADKTGVDSYSAFAGMSSLAFAIYKATQNTNRYGIALYTPAGQYETSKGIIVQAPGCYFDGDGPRTSVIKAQTGFTGNAIIAHSPADADTTMTGVGINNMGIDCNEVNISYGYLGETVYDGVQYNNVIIDRPGAACVGFALRKADITTGVDVCQSVQINNLLVQKYTVKGTVPAVLFDKVQEMVITASKAWNGFSVDGSGYGTAAPWFIQDCSTTVMIGCSSASTAQAGVEVYANTRPMDGIHLIDPMFENLQNPVLVDSASPTVNTIADFRVTNPRYESPVSGNYSINATVRGIVEVGSMPATLGAQSSSTTVVADQLTQVTDNGSNNSVNSIRNAVDNFQGFGQHISVVVGGETLLETHAPANGEFSFVGVFNNAGTLETRTVTAGAPGSGGTGQRMLTIAD